MPAPRHVLHVSMPTVAGVPRVLLGYLHDQVARGWAVDLACPPDGWLAERARLAGARVVDWPARREPGPATLGETRRLAEIVAGLSPQLVHLHSAKAGLAGRLAVRGSLPTVYQPHGWSFLAATGALRAATVRWERFAQRWTHALVLVSAAERALGTARGIAGPSWVIPNGVDVAELSAASPVDRSAARAALGLDTGPIAVCVGRLSAQKGQRDLLDVWPEVLRRVPGAALALVGDGPERAALEVRAGGGVHFPGERSDVAAWLAAATVVVAPSRWEGMALAPLEAMARGRSIVATDVPGMAEAVPADAGAVVAAGDRSALAHAVAERLADPARADAEGRNGRRHVVGHHDRALAAASLVNVYGSVLPAGR